MAIEPQQSSYRRPDFMMLLGLLPPYTEEDVKRVYWARARTAHPDGGGNAEEFIKLKEAYERALEYAHFHSSRRAWLGARVEEYIGREAVADEVQRRGGSVEIESIAWLREELGEDFAQVTDRLVGIRLSGAAVTDEAIDFLVREQANLRTLRHLDLAGSRITDMGVGRLRALRSLRRLDLRDTPISGQGLARLLPLPELEWLHIGGTRVGWWPRLRLWRSYPRMQVVARHSPSPALHKKGDSPLPSNEA
jgi:hypothetical protein